MTHLFTSPPKIKPYVEDPSLLPVDPANYLEQLEPRIILGSCLAFGGAEALLNQAAAADPKNSVNIPMPEFLNESRALRTARPSTEIPSLYTLSHDPFRELEQGNPEGGYFRNHDRNQTNWVAPQAGGASLTGKDTAGSRRNLPEVGSRSRSRSPSGGSSSSSGGASIIPEVIGGNPTPKEPEFIIEPIPPGPGPGPNPTDPTNPVDPTPSSPVLGASGPATIPVGKEYTLTLSITGPGSDTVKYWTIDWGDGTVDQIEGNPNKAKHIYETADDYVIKTSATNADKTYTGPSVPVRVTENRPPEFVSVPGTEAGVNRPWHYDAKAVDPDGDDLKYSLVSGPGGMTIDTNTGRLSWTPGAQYVGTHQVVIEARDPGGLSCRQEFTLTVAGDLQNRPPEITSTPGTTGYVGKEYTYQVEARDPDGDLLAYTLVDAPNGMMIDSQTGKITWTPTAEMADQTYSVKVLVEDGYGGSATQEYQITVLTPKNNGAPIFVTDPNTSHYTPGMGGATVGNVSHYTPDLDGNPVGDVSHDRLDLHLDIDEIKKQVASISIGEEIPMVDIFLTFDSTASFKSFAANLRTEFPKIIAAITEAMPDVSFAFGIGMFHDYYRGSEWYDSPFMLKQPVIATDAEGFMDAIDTALAAWRDGGYGHQSLIEALYQIATGKGYDGNNDGDTTDSGPAGLRETHMAPGTSGDVPAFDSFIPDPENNVLPPAGNIGGVGFRKGALPIIIAATDVPFNCQPDGSHEIVGADGVTLPTSYFDGGPRSTPHGTGATIQEAIEALNSIGALVIGMGTLGAKSNLQGLSILTGAVNGSDEAIDTGSRHVINPGDPYYFPYGDAETTAAGIIKAIQLAMKNTRHNIEVIASKDGVPLANLTGVIKNVGAGDTISFDLSFLGDGVEHDFDILFVKAGTGIILGSIPATIATTYRYDAKAIDPDGDSVTYSIVGDTNGARIDRDSGCIVWNPSGNGLYSFTVRATDEFGNFTDQVFDIQVGDRPTDAAPPTINGIENSQAEVDRKFSSKVDATSPNGEALSYYLVGTAPEGLNIDKKTGEMTWQPVLGQEGPYEVTVRVVSSEGVVAERKFTIDVMPKQVNRNTKPVFTSNPVEVAVYDRQYRYQVVARDAEGDPVTFRLLMAPEGMILDSATGLLLWNPGVADVGTHSIIIQADDGNGGLNLQVFTLEVNDGNFPPVFTSRPPAPPCAGSSYFYVVKADDPNGDTVTLTLDAISIANGITLDNETGLLVWTNIPAGAYQIVITASDGRGGVSTQAFILQIASNQPARIVSEPITFALKGNPYAYHIVTHDPNGDPVSLSLDQASIDRGMFIDAGGVLRWQSNVIGEYKVTLTAVDPSGAGMVQQFAVNVVESIPDNHPPVITSQPETVAWENTTYQYKVIASDPDSIQLNYGISCDKPVYGLDIDQDGNVSWINLYMRAGEYVITITVSDPIGAKAIQSFILTVNPMINRPPYIDSSPPKYNLNIGDDFSYRLRFIDPDIEKFGDACTVTVDDVSRALGFTVVPDGDNYALINWTADAPGVHTVTVTVTDKHGMQAVQTFTLRVFDTSEGITPNQPPRITTIPPTVVELGETYEYKAAAMDPNGDTVSLSLDAGSLALGMEIVDGVIRWTPTAKGEYVVTVTATDIHGAFAAQTYTIIVTDPHPPINRPAHFTSEPELLAKAGDEYRCLLEAADPEGGEVFISLQSGPSGMSMVGNELVWTPASAGQYWVFLKVTDAEGNGEIKKYLFTAINADNETVHYYYASGYVGEEFSQAISYVLPSGGEMTYTVDSRYDHLGIVIENDVMKWTPALATTQWVSITATNDQGERATLWYHFTTVLRHRPPTITSEPPTRATITESYVYQVEAEAANGGEIYYYSASKEDGSANVYNMSMDTRTGLLTINPVHASQLDCRIKVTVYDRNNWETTQIYNLTVDQPPGNRPPMITSAPPKAIWEAGEIMNHYIYTSDPDTYGSNHDYPTFTLNQEAVDAGISLKTFNGSYFAILSWSPTIEGSHNVVITVTDSNGASTQQSFTLHAVKRANRPVTIWSTPPTLGFVNEKYTYDISTWDYDSNYNGVELTLDQNSIDRGMTLAGNRLTWTPAQTGEYEITLALKNGNGDFATQTFILKVEERIYSGAESPYFTSDPITIGVVGNEYRYDFSVANPGGGQLSYSLGANSLASGMYLVGNTVVWDNPPASGAYTVAITVMNENGRGQTQAFRLHIIDTAKYSRPPTISSQPPQIAVAGRDYRYQVAAADPDGDELFYTLAKGPAGMSIDPATGLVSFKPSKTGTYEVEITVTDGNHILAQTYTLAVVANIPPQIGTSPNQTAHVGQEYTYQPQATDPNGDRFTWALESTVPGMAIDGQSGKITFHPAEAGVVDVVLVVRDEFGAETRQKWNILVRDPNVNAAPVIHSEIRGTIQIGTPLLHQIVATDSDGDKLSFSLVSGPFGMVVTDTGLLSWTPSSGETGLHSFTIQVKDERGAVSERIYSIAVVAQPVPNEAPTVTNTPPANAIVGEEWVFQALANDPEGDSVSFSLDSGPAGMKIDPQTGRYAWRPTAAQLGEHEFTFTVVDCYGAFSTYACTITVQLSNTAPAIVSTPPTVGKVGQPWVYQVVARDAEGDSVEYSLGPDAPPTMVIDPHTGRITFTSDVVGLFMVEVLATDGRGAVSSQAFILAIKEESANLPPVIQSKPVNCAEPEKEYVYQVVAHDPNGDALSYGLAKAPAGMKIDQNGRITWSPAANQTGDHRVEVTVFDGEAGVMQSFTIRVFTNSAPQFNDIDDKTVTAGKDFLLDTVARDADNDLLVYDLVEAPEGMAIDGHGRITWQTDDTHAGEGGKTHTVVVRARDPFMAEALVSFTVTVMRDTVPPEVSLTPSIVPAAVHTPVSFWVQAHDEGGIASMELTIDGKLVAMNEYGISTHVFATPGVHTIVATVRDAAGNETKKELSLLVFDPSDRTPPTVSWNVPGNHVVDKPFDLRASVRDPDSDVVSWTLTMQSKDTGVTRTLATGSGAIADAFLASIDPAEMANGPYILTLRAVDGSGHETEASQVVTIKSHYKVGNFNLSFQDMTVNLGGIPIVIQRTYDTFDAGKSGDFGHGWSMSYIPVTLRDNIGVDLRKDPAAALYVDAAFYLGAKITVRMPDGKTEVFTVDYQAPQFALPGQNTYQVKFVAESGSGATLSLANGSPYFTLDEEGRFIAGGLPFNPGSVYTPYDYVLATEDGMRFNIDGRTGQCTRAGEPGGNYLEVRDNGIRSYDSAGTLRGEVIFERDDKGRITAIKDTTGQTVAYSYDAKGDLVAVTSSSTGTVTLEYLDESGAPEHYLKSITDKNGVTAIEVGYDYVTGRITGITDAAGNSTGVSFVTQVGPGLTAESVTDALGRVTETVVDADGNVVRTIKHIPDDNDPANRSKFRYQIIVEEFDAKGNSLGKARPFEVSEAELRALGRNQYDYLPDDLYWESRSKYDAKGRQTQSTDAYGQTTYYSYDSRGNLLTTVDPLGRVSKNIYDHEGRLHQTVDASGTVSVYTYDAKGNVTSVTQILVDGTEQKMNTVEYRSDGKVSSMTDATGAVTHYGYDADGRQIFTKTVTKDPHDANVTHTTATFTEYNADGKASKTWQEVDGVRTSVTEYTYTVSGQTETTTDKYGLVSKTIYDIAGREIESRRQAITETGVRVWLVSRTVYDAAGQVTWTQDEHVEADPDAAPQSASGTHTVYDALGREVKTERRDNVLIRVTGSGAAIKTEVVSTGTLVSDTESGYDSAGRTAWSKSAAGVVTLYFYTVEGALSHTTIDRDGNLSTTHDQYSVNRTVYDEYGRQKESILDRDGDLSTTGDQSKTQYVYDSQGRLVRTVYGDGTYTSVSYDAMGRKASETNQLGQTTHYEYDSQGRLTAVILPKVKHPTTGEDVHVRYEYGYDARGNQTSLRDNIFQTDPAKASTIDRAAQRETVFTFDWRGNQTTRTLPDGSKEYFHYDEYGRQSRHVSFEGRVTYYEYDALDRLSGKYFYESEAAWNNGAGTVSQSIVYTYDLYGRVIKEVDSATGTTTTAYNPEGGVSRITSPQGTINYEYDPITGQVARTWTGTDAANPVTDVRNTYDAEGRLETVTTRAREGALLSTPETARYIYDLIGALDKIVHSNGVISDYDYDGLNRLKELTHYAPDDTPDDLSDNEILQRYTYDYYADGNKSGETFTDKDGSIHTWNWVYDQLGRLVKEVHDNADDTLDYTTQYKYDLVGNRLEKATDKGNDGSIDELIKSQFDKNDRLLNDTRYLDGTAAEKTTYVYNKTEQIAKTVTDLINSRVESKTTMSYNAQGRLSKLVIDTYTNGTKSQSVTQEYAYDSSGIKIRQIESVDSNADGIADATRDTSYLNDAQNHTGYSQVLEERTTENGQPVKVTTYTIGHDVLSQYTAALGVLSILADGHGSTRAVANKLGQILQQYNYDAYGNAHGFDPAQAHTNLLYSGEQFNPVSGLQYLRARWYNPQSGRFNRLDPYSGNQQSPLSYHKYAYAHMDPVMGSDPSGLFIMGLNASFFVQGFLSAASFTATIAVTKAVALSLYTITLAQLHLSWIASEMQDLATTIRTMGYVHEGASTLAAKLEKTAVQLLEVRNDVTQSTVENLILKVTVGSIPYIGTAAVVALTIRTLMNLGTTVAAVYGSTNLATGAVNETAKWIKLPLRIDEAPGTNLGSGLWLAIKLGTMYVRPSKWFYLTNQTLKSFNRGDLYNTYYFGEALYRELQADLGGLFDVKYGAGVSQ